ncbi:hypothetical protein [Oceanimonas sp. CAM02]|uniref:pPIWI_RE_Z domain-containing protein n=1 Tax=Oceanimonas sp. CAM02 TaxID=3080336 RepID=UPI0029356839|nr:hypothetical protein [Oceanimonas sp. CAM02]MDV2858654.1 hypothetical protein [Oceanimonas sp. CAM02]
MRTDLQFIDEYCNALALTEPAAARLNQHHLRTLALTELCFVVLSEYLPEQDITAVPALMLGYPSLVAGATAHPALANALCNLRHLCGRFGSVAVWSDNCRHYREQPATLRSFDITENKPTLKQFAHPRVLTLLHQTLAGAVPWVIRDIKLASPGSARVKVNNGNTVYSYQIPVTNITAGSVQQHALSPRHERQPVRIKLSELIAAAKDIDSTERQPDWPASLPPLRLEQRLQQTLNLKSLSNDFFDGDTITLNGSTHLVGMLSSGKSTLVMALLFALTKGQQPKRIAMIVNDTIQGATLSSRLKRHGIRATVLSSLRRRETHLDAIHWQQGQRHTGWAISSLGDLASSFSVSCPLDGMQPESPPVVRGERSRRFPDFSEKPCHNLRQTTLSDHEKISAVQSQQQDGKAHSCPLWAQCPAQSQQRDATTAQVLIMTSAAFAYMSPDKWTRAEHLTLPELLQYDIDLVIVDEADAVQANLDNAFVPSTAIMGSAPDVYIPVIGMRTSEKIREKSGLQYRNATATRWHNNFHVFSRLIGTLYALLQRERASLCKVYQNTPFTAAGLLYGLWREINPVKNTAGHQQQAEQDFQQIIQVASAISSALPINTSTMASRQSSFLFTDTGYEQAAHALQAIAKDVLLHDHVEDLTTQIESLLNTELAVFCLPDSQSVVTRRENALRLLLTVIAELALSYYNWLIKAQPAVAEDFGLNDEELFTKANHLIRHYRSLLPTNPSGAIFGLLYDEPGQDKLDRQGGQLTLINHLGVGRYLLTHLHQLLAAEGQVGPNVLMLSGTSWAGGSHTDNASPVFDVQVPVKGILLQPNAELDAIAHSTFALVHLPRQTGEQVRVSGTSPERRRDNLTFIAHGLASNADGITLLEQQWQRLEQQWGASCLHNRRRALLVTNSYADAAHTADQLRQCLDKNGFGDWRVYCLVRDKADENASDQRPQLARPLPRSLIEQFGNTPEKSVLVAPVQVVSRGHNILNSANKAAISSIYFLHRPHPRPDDLSAVTGRLNRFAIAQINQSSEHLSKTAPLAERARRMRNKATHIVRLSLDYRSQYSGLPATYKAQFAWNLLAPLWQTTGRGIRGGCPVFVGFVDERFAPHSFECIDNKPDTPGSSVLVQMVKQLQQAMDPRYNPNEHDIAQLLYEPFYLALKQTQGLQYGDLS